MALCLPVLSLAHPLCMEDPSERRASTTPGREGKCWDDTVTVPFVELSHHLHARVGLVYSKLYVAIFYNYKYSI